MNTGPRRSGAAPWRLACAGCGAAADPTTTAYRCACGDLLEVVPRLPDRADRDAWTATFDRRRGGGEAIDRSGVWRFREWILPLEPASLVTRPEGATNLYDAPRIARWAGLSRLQLKHEGENPTGSFKDRGMCVAITAARRLGYAEVACASTGNTAASMAAYAARCGMRATVFLPAGKIATGKLAQALAYGARTLAIDGDFDAAMRLVGPVCAAEGVFLVNSINPFRIEGQKSLLLELLQDRGWSPPDWIVVPGGNLGNASAIAKSIRELRQAGWIDRVPRLAVVQAAGAAPLARAFELGVDVTPWPAPDTIATAIRIGAPVSWRRCLRGIRETDGVAIPVDDADILSAKCAVDADGIGAEPASCAVVAGARALVRRGVIAPDADVCGVLTGNLLKDPDAVTRFHAGELPGAGRRNAPVPVAAELDAIRAALAAARDRHA